MKNLVFALFILVGQPCFSQLDCFDAARQNDVSRLMELWKIDADTLSSKNENGFTPLILAIYYGHQEASIYLIEQGVEVNYISQEGTALNGAAVKGYVQLAKMLLENGADPNLSDASGNTPLIYSAMIGHEEMAELLLNHKANKNQKDSRGWTALDWAKKNNRENLIRVLDMPEEDEPK